MDITGVVPDGLIDIPEVPGQQPQQAPPHHQHGPQANAQPQVQIPIARIQVSDISGFTEVDEILDTKLKNWSGWSQSMCLLLDVVNGVPYVEGKVKRPNPEIDPEGAENWSFNDAYIMILILQNIAPCEMIHVRGCQSAYQMWKNLRSIHHLTGIQIQTNRLRFLQNIRAKEGDDIPQHLVKLKNQWELVSYFGNEDNRRMYDDDFVKLQIAISLPRSWDSFTGPYVEGHVDDDPLQADSMKKIDSQQLIGIINQKYYELNESRRQEETDNPPKGEKFSPSLAHHSHERRRCKHCGKGGHYTSQCRHLGKNKCRKCNRYGHDTDKCTQAQPSDYKRKRKSNNNNHPNGNKRSRTEGQIADVDDDELVAF